jgi:cytochrome c oxidase accessory protein FixG
MKDSLTTDDPEPRQKGESANQDIDWKDFRDHLATADQQGHRMWLYPKKPKGRIYNFRTWFSYLLLVILFTGPFIRINGNPLLLFNIVERKFSIFGQIFWPQDTFLFALGMLIWIISIVVFTAVFGRVWCGWACPQTLLMEMVFRKIEYWIDGDSLEQKKLSKAPWTGGKIAKRVAKYSVFFGLSFVIGNTLLAYVIGTENLYAIITDNPLNHTQGLAAMVIFTLIFFAIFARFREQACTFICPYGRFQSTLLDENTIVVAYDHKRGESRQRLNRNQSESERQEKGVGDCVDCNQCVAVCPTGIDIRNGTQMECVNCAACIDACNGVMSKLKRPLGLVRYASLNGIEKGLPLKVTPRIIGYSVVLTALVTAFFTLLLTRSDVETSLLRAPGTLFQTTPDGRVTNLYLLKLTNKTSHDIPVDLRLMGMEAGSIRVMGGDIIVKAGSLAESSVLVELGPDLMDGKKTRIEVGVFSGQEELERVRTVFVGPQGKVP